MISHHTTDPPLLMSTIFPKTTGSVVRFSGFSIFLSICLGKTFLIKNVFGLQDCGKRRGPVVSNSTDGAFVSDRAPQAREKKCVSGGVFFVNSVKSERLHDVDVVEILRWFF